MNRVWVFLGTWLAAASALAQTPGADWALAQISNSTWVVSVILPQAKAMDPDRLAAAVRKRVDARDRFTGTEKGDNLVLLRIGGGTAMAALMDRPVPNQELQRVCQYAWYWRGACDAVGNHQAHYLVVLSGGEYDKLSSALLHTKIVAAVLEESDAVAAYWGVNLQSREDFLEGSARASAESPPVMLWVSFRVSRDESGLSVSTAGLQSFGLMEIETRNARMPGGEVLDLIHGTSQYLITRGPVIKDGDTIGHSSEQRIRVRHADSFWNEGQKVYRVEIGTSP